MDAITMLVNAAIQHGCGGDHDGGDECVAFIQRKIGVVHGDVASHMLHDAFTLPYDEMRNALVSYVNAELNGMWTA